jgi:hypothetical protein
MATVSFKLKNPSNEKKSSIVVEFYISRQVRTIISTKEKCFEKDWSGSRVKSAPVRANINTHLSSIENGLMELWRNHSKDLSREQIIERAIGIVQGVTATPSQKKTLFTALDNFLSQYQADKEPKTLFKYEALKHRLTDFANQYPVDFETLDYNFYDQFKKYLYGIPNPNYPDCVLIWSGTDNAYLIQKRADNIVGNPVGLFDDTVFKYLVNLKTFLASAEKRGYKVHPSYKEWEIIKRAYPPIALTIDELEQLENATIKKEYSLARDYFTIEARTGARISDIERFKIGDVKERIEEGQVIHEWIYSPVKGSRLHKQSITLPFMGYSAPAWWTLAKHNFQLPKISQQKLNKGIKKACKEAGLNQEIITERFIGSKRVLITGEKWEFISTHTGKKTFITHMAESETPLHMIGQMCATTVQTIIKHYIGKSDSKMISKYLMKAKGNKSDFTVMRKAE